MKQPLYESCIGKIRNALLDNDEKLFYKVIEKVYRSNLQLTYHNIHDQIIIPLEDIFQELRRR